MFFLSTFVSPPPSPFTWYIQYGRGMCILTCSTSTSCVMEAPRMKGNNCLWGSRGNFVHPVVHPAPLFGTGAMSGGHHCCGDHQMIFMPDCLPALAIWYLGRAHIGQTLCFGDQWAIVHARIICPNLIFGYGGYVMEGTLCFWGSMVDFIGQTGCPALSLDTVVHHSLQQYLESPSVPSAQQR